MAQRTAAVLVLGLATASVGSALFLGVAAAAAEPASGTDPSSSTSAETGRDRAPRVERPPRAERTSSGERTPRGHTADAGDGPRGDRGDHIDPEDTQRRQPRIRMTSGAPAPAADTSEPRRFFGPERGLSAGGRRAAATEDPAADGPPIAARVVTGEGDVEPSSPRPSGDTAHESARERLAGPRRHAAAATPETTTVATRIQLADDGPLPSPPRRASLLNVVGSLVLNTLIGLIHLADGPPVLPPNSTVTVRTSTLTLPIGSGRAVQADWYFPEDADDSTRLIYFQHGFLASGPMCSYAIAHLAESTDSIVVAPSLSSNFFSPSAEWVGGATDQRAVADLFVGARQALTESAGAAAGHDVVLPQDFVLVGHSAGGTLVTSVAGFLADNGAIADLKGVVMLDGVEPAGSPFVSNALSKLRGDDARPIYLISSDRYFWSRDGDMADKLQLARPDQFNGVHLVGGRHIDYLQGGNKILQFAEYLTAGFSKPENIDAAEILTAGWVDDMFTGTTAAGVYGTAEQSIPISTAAGVADAVVLPLGYPAKPVWNPLFEAVLTAIFDYGGRHWFVYEPLPGHEVSVGGARQRVA